MRKYRIILTKKGEIYITSDYSHDILIDNNKVTGRDWYDWVRIVIDTDGNFRVREKHDMPEWLERQYGYFKDKIKQEVLKYEKKILRV